jgi:hypothetical protein
MQLERKPDSGTTRDRWLGMSRDTRASDGCHSVVHDLVRASGLWSSLRQVRMRQSHFAAPEKAEGGPSVDDDDSPTWNC